MIYVTGFLVAGLATLVAPAHLQRYEYAQVSMGTRFRIVLYARDALEGRRAADAAFARIAELDQIMSDYKDDSELMNLCRHAGGEPVRVSPELFAILKRSHEISRLTEGAFDVTVGPLSRLWRRSRRQRELPSPRKLSEAKDLVGHTLVKLDEKAQSVQLVRQGMLLDLGGIAKGYAADEALSVLRKHAITRALVAAGGDVVAGDPPPNAEGWKVGILPLEGAEKPPTQFLLLRNAAVSTSGDTEQFVEIGGKRYSHILDPRTGLGLTTRSSVTVVAPNGMTSDSLATAVSVLGPARGMELIDRTPGTAAFFSGIEEGQQRERPSKAWGELRRIKAGE